MTINLFKRLLLLQLSSADAISTLHLDSADPIALRVVCARHTMQLAARAARIYITFRGIFKAVVWRVLATICVANDLTARGIVVVI